MRKHPSNPFEALHNRPAPLAADPWLRPFAGALAERSVRADRLEKRLAGGGTLADFASGHEYFGVHHRSSGGWVCREWAPNASRIVMRGDFSEWRLEKRYEFTPADNGQWILELPEEALSHAQKYLLYMEFKSGGAGDRVPAWARRVWQDEQTKLFCAVIDAPPRPYVFRHASPPRPEFQLIYESHVGMAQEEAKVGSFAEYRKNILPRLAASGYNTVQLMALMAHPYYGSFGYHVANFFAPASRFGTPDELKELIDAAHGLGLRVIMDIVHSHATRNEVEGIARYDGSRECFFHAGARGEHQGWDSLCFDYGKVEVLHFLLSNCRYWLDEFKIDGFRFDGVTSMLYLHHGMNHNFGDYGEYFSDAVDEDAVSYLVLANRVVHEVRPDAVTVAEDVSGMPGLAASQGQPGGIGFDYRMAMGVTDMWFKLFDIPDENWNMYWLWSELCNRRNDERSISYPECHDQSIVGGKSAIFTLADAEMYRSMSKFTHSLIVDRAVALHKMVRLATLAAAGDGYLNFMGNEFGHPEWVDFPREGNGWSYYYARRQWSLSENPDLRYMQLRDFDRAMLAVVNSAPEFGDSRVQLIRVDDVAKVIIFERAGYYFILNFHPQNSYPEYCFDVPGGSFATALDSDDARFGGFCRRPPDQRYTAMLAPDGWRIGCYLPCRTALVLKRVD